MKLKEIKEAVDKGLKVHWSNEGYTVVPHCGDYAISHANGSMIGLTWTDGVTMNGREDQFFLGEEPNGL